MESSILSLKRIIYKVTNLIKSRASISMEQLSKGGLIAGFDYNRDIDTSSSLLLLNLMPTAQYNLP